MLREMEYRKNDVVTVTIEDMGHDGAGIGKAAGYTIFVKDAVVGDVVEASIMKAKKNYAYGKLKKVVTPSSFRVTPRCEFHRQCGGCQLQALSYGRQLKFKEDKIGSNLVRIGGFAPELVERVMEPIVGMEVTTEEGAFRYRNKAQYPVGTDREGNPVTGFYAGRTHDIIANTECYLGAAINKEILEIILNYMKKYRVSAYDEKSGTGLIRHILIRMGFASGEIMVCLVVNGKSTKGQDILENGISGKQFLPEQQVLIDALKDIAGMASISVNLNSQRTNVIMGKEGYLLWGKDTISDTIHVRDVANDFALTERRIGFQISPLSFYQINPVQTEKLYSLVLQYAELTGKETVWDLYCGIGTISLFLAGYARQVYGVEMVPEAIRDAKMNAVNNGITNAEFFVGKVEEVLPVKYEREGTRADVMVVDPPRKGCDWECLGTILAMQPERIVYVSCDSATLARDLRVLCEGGYELRRGRGVDQFGGTVHVETVVLLSKLKAAESIEVKVEFDEMELTTAESKATYEEIKQYVFDNAGLKVSQLYVAQVKRKHGVIERVNYNVGDGKSKVPKVPLEKEQAIEDALRYFKMI